MKILFPSYELVDKQPTMSDDTKKELDIFWKEWHEKLDRELMEDIARLKI